MNQRGYADPALYLGLPVWLCAALVFPLQLGLAGGSVASLVLYLAVAGALLSLADAFHDPGTYGNWQVALFEGLLKVLGLAVPAALAFTLGWLVAPTEPAFEPSYCAPGNYAAAADRAGGDWLLLDGDCREQGGLRRS